MSAAGTRVSALGLRELTDSELAALLVQADGIMRVSEVALPAVFHSERLRDDDAFMQFSRENRPLRFERYPEGEILVMTPVGLKGSNWEVYIASRLMAWAEEHGTGMAWAEWRIQIRQRNGSGPGCRLVCNREVGCVDSRSAGETWFISPRLSRRAALPE